MIKLEPTDRPEDESAPLHSSDNFRECDACRVKPGIPDLCVICLHNRSLISALKAKIVALTPKPAPKCPQCGNQWLHYSGPTMDDKYLAVCTQCNWNETVGW